MSRQAKRVATQAPHSDDSVRNLVRIEHPLALATIRFLAIIWQMMRQRLLSIFKAAFLIGLLAILVYQFLHSVDSADLQELRSRNWNWGLFCLAIVTFVFAETLTFVRWHTLLVAVGIKASLPETLRLGFIGFLMQFFTLGTVGGDVVKAFLVARRHFRETAAAVTSILMDRLVGFLGMLVLASVMFCYLVVTGQLTPLLRTMAIGCAIGTAIGLGAFLVVFWTGWTAVSMLGPLRQSHRIRAIAARIDTILLPFKNERRPVLLGVGYSLAAHILQATAMFLAARSVFPQSPTLWQQWIIWPLAAAAGALPISPAGLGTFEFAYAELYDQWQAGDVADQGLIVAILFRILCLVTAAVGLFFYLSQRGEVKAAVEAARSVAEPVAVNE